jgi:hypothetical protein
VSKLTRGIQDWRRFELMAKKSSFAAAKIRCFDPSATEMYQPVGIVKRKLTLHIVSTLMETAHSACGDGTVPTTASFAALAVPIGVALFDSGQSGSSASRADCFRAVT